MSLSAIAQACSFVADEKQKCSDKIPATSYLNHEKILGKLDGSNHAFSTVFGKNMFEMHAPRHPINNNQKYSQGTEIRKYILELCTLQGESFHWNLSFPISLMVNSLKFNSLEL